MSYNCDNCENEDGRGECWVLNCINGSSFKSESYNIKIEAKEKNTSPTVQKFYCPFCGNELTELFKDTKNKRISAAYESIRKILKENEITWDELKKQIKQKAQHDMNRYKLIEITCPKCGQRTYKDTAMILTSNPPQYGYECFKCGWHGTSY